MIYVDNRQDKIEVDGEFENIIKEVIDYSLKEEKVEIGYEVSVVFVDNSEIREINRENRGIDKATDVLSFPMLEYPNDKVFKDTYLNYGFKCEDLDNNNVVLGDIVLSLERAKEQSIEYGHSFLREACYLTVHSVLHLLGYDHMEDNEKVIMRKREEEMLSKFHLIR